MTRSTTPTWGLRRGAHRHRRRGRRCGIPQSVASSDGGVFETVGGHITGRCPWTLPDGRTVTFAAEALRGWVRAYQREGLDGLEDASRVDIGVRVLTPEQIELVCQLKRQVPERSIERVIQIAEELNKVPKGLLKRSTVHRVLSSQGLSRRPKGKTATDDLDRFEAAWPTLHRRPLALHPRRRLVLQE